MRGSLSILKRCSWRIGRLKQSHSQSPQPRERRRARVQPKAWEHRKANAERDLQALTRSVRATLRARLGAGRERLLFFFEQAREAMRCALTISPGDAQTLGIDPSSP